MVDLARLRSGHYFVLVHNTLAWMCACVYASGMPTKSRSEIATQQWSALNTEQRRGQTRNASIATRARALLRQHDRAVDLLRSMGYELPEPIDLGTRIYALARSQQERKEQG